MRTAQYQKTGAGLMAKRKRTATQATVSAGSPCPNCGCDGTLETLAAKNLKAERDALRSEIKPLTEVARRLDQLDWEDGQELSSRNANILHDALTQAREILHPQF
jgi:hypothetical protein